MKQLLLAFLLVAACGSEGVSVDASTDGTASCDGTVNASCDPSCPGVVNTVPHSAPCTIPGKRCGTDIYCLVCMSDDGGASGHWTGFDEACSKF